MRVDFSFAKGGGYAVLHRDRSRSTCPRTTGSTFQCAASARPQNLEFKLIDASGDNVWWLQPPRRSRTLASGRRVITRKRQISFAWGRRAAARPRQRRRRSSSRSPPAAGAAGTVWLDDSDARAAAAAPRDAAAPVATRRRARATDAANAVDGDATTRVGERRARPLAVARAGPRHAARVRRAHASTGTQARTRASTIGPELGRRHARGGRHVRTSRRRSRLAATCPRARRADPRPRARARARGDRSDPRRSRCSRSSGQPRPSIPESIARESAGAASYPRGVLGEQSYWTVVRRGRRHRAKALLDEDAGRSRRGHGASGRSSRSCCDGTGCSTWSDRRPATTGDSPPADVPGRCRAFADARPRVRRSHRRSAMSAAARGRSRSLGVARYTGRGEPDRRRGARARARRSRSGRSR